MSELAFNTKYIICCDTGRRSESAGFLLSHQGFDVYVLEGGIPESSSEAAPEDTPDTDKPEADVANTDSGSQSAVHNEELASLRAENEKLLGHLVEGNAAFEQIHFFG